MYDEIKILMANFALFFWGISSQERFYPEMTKFMTPISFFSPSHLSVLINDVESVEKLRSLTSFVCQSCVSRIRWSFLSIVNRRSSNDHFCLPRLLTRLVKSFQKDDKKERGKLMITISSHPRCCEKGWPGLNGVKSLWPWKMKVLCTFQLERLVLSDPWRWKPDINRTF